MQAAITARVRSSDDFDENNDPHAEHDFGSFDHDGRTIFWKIDLYDRDYQWYSPAPNRSREDQSRSDDPPRRGVLTVASEPGSPGSGSKVFRIAGAADAGTRDGCRS
jgi:Protein of unknown function (DUF3768)